MKIGLASLAVVLVLHFPQKNDQPVAVEEEPLHKVEFKNDAVTVMRLILPPGQYTQYHIHTHDRVAVQLSTTSTTQQDWKKPEGPANPVKPGDFAAMLIEGTPLPEKPRTPPPSTPPLAPAADPKVVRPELRPAPGFTRGDSPAKA